MSPDVTAVCPVGVCVEGERATSPLGALRLLTEREIEFRLGSDRRYTVAVLSLELT